MKFKRTIEIEPAYDRRSKDPSKNYGIHGCNMRFLLKGRHGVVQFLLYTNWQLPKVQDELIKTGVQKTDAWIRCMFLPMPADVGYHSPVPLYVGQNPMGKCNYLGGKVCYYDGSGMDAEHVYKVMLEEGDKGVWRELENYYRSTFLAKDDPTQ